MGLRTARSVFIILAFKAGMTISLNDFIYALLTIEIFTGLAFITNCFENGRGKEINHPLLNLRE